MFTFTLIDMCSSHGVASRSAEHSGVMAWFVGEWRQAVSSYRVLNLVDTGTVLIGMTRGLWLGRLP